MSFNASMISLWLSLIHAQKLVHNEKVCTCVRSISSVPPLDMAVINEWISLHDCEINWQFFSSSLRMRFWWKRWLNEDSDLELNEEAETAQVKWKLQTGCCYWVFRILCLNAHSMAANVINYFNFVLFCSSNVKCCHRVLCIDHLAVSWEILWLACGW